MANIATGTPQVSVLMPVYNRPEMVARAIDSVLAQTFDDFEFIIVDDGSTDATPDVLARYGDPRIRILTMPHNVGESSARNVGLSAVRAPYLAVADSDDVCRPGRLEAQVARMEAEPGLTACGTGAQRVVMGRPEKRAIPHEADGEIKARMVITDGSFFHSSLLIRRSIFDLQGVRYNSSQRVCSDYDLCLSMMERGGAVFTNLREPLIEYHIHDEGESRTTPDLDAHKTLLRRRVLTLYYPGLTRREICALADAFNLRKQLSVREAACAVSAAEKAAKDTTSRYGEDRARLRDILTRAINTLMLHIASKGEAALAAGPAEAAAGS